MECPREIAAILLQLTGLGLLRIRARPGDPARSLVEADHIHNLPGLVRDFSPAMLSYYWEVERPAFVERTPDRDLACFEALWGELQAHAEASLVAPSR